MGIARVSESRKTFVTTENVIVVVGKCTQYEIAKYEKSDRGRFPEYGDRQQKTMWYTKNRYSLRRRRK